MIITYFISDDEMVSRNKSAVDLAFEIFEQQILNPRVLQGYEVKYNNYRDIPLFARKGNKVTIDYEFKYFLSDEELIYLEERLEVGL